MSVLLEELIEEFQDLETPEERIQFLIELGQSLPEFPKEYCTEEFRVVGCQSMVWVVPQWDGATFQFQATSDAPMVRGLAAVLVSAYSGRTAQEVVDLPIEKIFDGLKLKSFLSPLRSNGLNSMIKQIREYAAGKLDKVEPASRVAFRDRSDFGPVSDRLIDIRSDFPVLDGPHSSGLPVAYLDNAASSQRPQVVIDAMNSVYQQHYANVHRSGHEWAGMTTEKIEASRLAVQHYINACSPDEIIFTSGTTASVNLVAQTWGRSNLKSGDEILLTEMEHHSNIVPWQQLCAELGCVIRWVPIRDDYTLDLEAFHRLLNEKTRIVACTAVSNVLGTINPVREICEASHRLNAVVLVDAAQSVPHGMLDVIEWDADFVVFSGHKMLASTGVGVCYGKRALLEEMPSWQGGGNMIKSVTFDGFTEAGLPHKFEAGTPAIVEIISLKSAIEYLTTIGSERILEHENLLADRAIEGLSSIPGIRIFSPPLAKKCGIVSFAIDGIHGEQIARLLDARGIAIRVGHHCAMPLHSKFGVSVTCRASFYIYNSIGEVDRLIAAVKDSV
jgi:cysteine desulfurase/selenocysteine lyase